MERIPPKLRLRQGLAFFGRISASISHEINNVISIIGEVTGLLDDLILLSERGRPIGVEKLKTLAERIKNQVERGKAVVKQMNLFAHSVDEPAADVDLNLAVENVAALSQRFAARRKTCIEVESAPGPATLAGGPFDFREAVFLCLDVLLQVQTSERPIRISLSDSEERIEICLRGDPSDYNDEGTKQRLAYAADLAADMGGRLEAEATAEESVLKLRFPLSRR